ncbi:hypothetical protein [Algibacillus agarilyticus]|nr:hypothetical protein [Algibacillus agarilyticus]
MSSAKLVRGFLKAVYWFVIVAVVFGVLYLGFNAFDTYQTANA